jgi:Ser/Thr protein kinase RdoA (MazF antagonist)
MRPGARKPTGAAAGGARSDEPAGESAGEPAGEPTGKPAGEPADEPADEPFAALTPDAILDAIDAVTAGGAMAGGARATGQVLALNSYENRVFQVGMESPQSREPMAPVVVKFYRPGRWSDAQILEEHAFLDELAEAEVPAVPALRLDGRSLHTVAGFRFAMFERRGGRTPELSDPSTRERIGRFLGRLHAVGARRPFDTRLHLNATTFGRVPADYLLAGDWLPPQLVDIYRGLVEHALELVQRAVAQAQPRLQRVHGDCHPGNVLWNDSGAEPGPHFVDFDDSAMAPAVQDLWMLLSGSPEDMAAQLRDVLRGYELFLPFERAQLLLIEPLRTLRLIHYAAWIARRWNDPAFPAAFPWFLEPRYWEARILELREQLAAMQEPPIEP